MVDATCGNGHDTLELARLVLPADGSTGGKGLVVGVDIQEPAVANTRQRLQAQLSEEQLQLTRVYQGCHSDLEQYLPQELFAGQRVRMVCFNLGYLPGSDKSIITTHRTTLEALKSALACLDIDGLISIMGECLPRRSHAVLPILFACRIL